MLYSFSCTVADDDDDVINFCARSAFFPGAYGAHYSTLSVTYGAVLMKRNKFGILECDRCVLGRYMVLRSPPGHLRQGYTMVNLSTFFNGLLLCAYASFSGRSTLSGPPR